MDEAVKQGDTPLVCGRYSRDIGEMCARYRRDTGEIYARYGRYAAGHLALALTLALALAHPLYLPHICQVTYLWTHGANLGRPNGDAKPKSLELIAGAMVLPQPS